MKELIVGLAMLMLLILFPLQNALDIMNHRRMEKVDILVQKATQTARVDGYFTPENIHRLKNEILAAVPGLTEAEITLSVTTTPKYRQNQFDEREVIDYEIGIPIKHVIVASGFFGLPEGENRFSYIKRGYVLSEVPMP